MYFLHAIRSVTWSQLQLLVGKPYVERIQTYVDHWISRLQASQAPELGTPRGQSIFVQNTGTPFFSTLSKIFQDVRFTRRVRSRRDARTGCGGGQTLS